MRYLIAIIAAVVFTATGVQAVSAQKEKKQNTETVVFDVNINCDNCKAKLEKNIPFEKGVKDMDVDVEGKLVTVTFDTRKNTVEGIAEAIEKLGYKVSVAEEEV